MRAALHYVHDQSIRIGEMDIQTSVSIGVASREASISEADNLVVAADQALYAAKNAGRNRTCIVVNGKVHCGKA